MNGIKALWVLSFLTYFTVVAAQRKPHMSRETYAYDSMPGKHHFRHIITQASVPEYETDRIGFMYEWRLAKAITLVSQAGIGIVLDKFGEGSDIYRISLHGYGSLEARFYFWQSRRIKKRRPIKHAQGFYTGIEQNVFSNAILTHQITREDAFTGNSGFFVNAGYQNQGKRFYLGLHFGVAPWRRQFLKYVFDDGRINRLHGGITVGLVFGKKAVEK